MDFGRENGGKLVPTSNEKSMLIAKGDFLKKQCFSLKNNDFEGSGGGSWEQKSIKNRSKVKVQDGVRLGIDFQSIQVDFGNQVGTKIEQKSIPKGIKKLIQNFSRSGD